MAYQVDTVFVWVGEISEAVGWYREFGIEPGPRNGGWQDMMVDGDVFFALHEGPRHDQGPTAVVAFRVDDLDHEMRRLSGMAIHPVDEVTDIGHAKFVTYSDPFGNHVQLLQR